MNGTFKVTKLDGTSYCRACEQRTMDIIDRRDIRIPHIDFGEHLVLTDTIHLSFLEQFTLQLSPKIFQAVGFELPESWQILFVDRLFVEQGENFYIMFALSNHSIEFCEYVWAKCFADLSLLDLSIQNELTFELCSAQEIEKCQIIRLGHTQRIDWLKETKESLKSASRRRKTKKEPELEEPSYPDVTVKCHMKTRVNEEMKKRIFQNVTDFITLWNSDDANIDKIHDAALLESQEKKILSIFIDFGNCDPSVLEKLLYHLYDSNLDIEQISVA